MTMNFQALAARLAEDGVDQTKIIAAGDSAPPAAGPCRLRFVSYIECGIHTTTYQGQKKTKPRVQLVFELSGPKHPPLEFEGVKRPHRITITEAISQSEKGNFVKLFKLMNTDKKATHFVQLLGSAYRGTVVHNEKGGKVYAHLRNDQGYTIQPVTYEDPETGEVKTVKVDPPMSPIRALVWDYADLEQWDSLFIDGDYNPYQNKVRSAENFAGSPVQAALLAAGRNAEATPLSAAESEDGGEPAAPETAAPAPVAPPSRGPATAGPAVTRPAKAAPAADEDIPW